MKKVTFTILIFAFLAAITILPRLYRINAPLADWHSWRQADTISVTKFLIEDNFDVLHPRYYDISKIQSGYENPLGLRYVEFPIYNLIHAAIFLSTPLSFEVSARVVSILAAIIISWTLFLIGRKMAGFWSGIFSSVVFAILPFSIYFTRVTLPDPLSTAFGLLGAYLFWEYSDSNKKLFLFSSAVSFSLGMLVKPFAAFYAIPALFLAYKKWGFSSSILNAGLIAIALFFAPFLMLQGLVGPVDVVIALCIAVFFVSILVAAYKHKIKQFMPEYLAILIILLPVIAWRAWFQSPERFIGVPFSDWLLNGNDIRFRPSWWFWVFGERIGKLISGYWGLVLLGAGFLSAKSKDMLIYLGIAAFAYLSIFATANVQHDYYQTLIIPIVALAMGHGIYSIYSTRYLNKIYASIFVIFTLAMTVLLSFYWVRENYKINDYAMLAAAERIQEISDPDDLIIAPYNGNSLFLYQSDRQGWPVVTTNIDEMISWGAKYYVSTSKEDTDSKNFKNRFELVEETGQYIILKLVNK